MINKIHRTEVCEVGMLTYISIRISGIRSMNILRKYIYTAGTFSECKGPFQNSHRHSICGYVLKLVSGCSPTVPHTLDKDRSPHQPLDQIQAIKSERNPHHIYLYTQISFAYVCFYLFQPFCGHDEAHPCVMVASKCHSHTSSRTNVSAEIY